MAFRLIVPALMLITLMVAGLEAQEQPALPPPPVPATPIRPPQPPRPVPVPARPPQPADEETTPQLTSFQLDLFELRCPAGQVVSVEAGGLQESNNISAAQLLEALKGIGETRLLVRIADTADLSKPYTFKHGKNVPTVRNASRTPDGRVVPSVNYQDVGVTAELSGAWASHDQKQLRLELALELSALSKTSLETESVVDMPVFTQVKLKKTLLLESGRPAPLLVVSGLPYPQEEEGNVLLYVLRTVATRVDDGVNAAALTEPTPDPWQTMISTIIMEFQPTHAGLSTRQLEELLTKQGGQVEAAERLEELGSFEVLSRPTMLVRWPQEATINIGEKVPMPPMTAGQQSDAEPPLVGEAGDAGEGSPPMVELGLNLSVQGQWRTGMEPAQADLSVFSRSTRLSTVKVAADGTSSTAGQSMEIPVVQQRQSQLTTRENQPAWLVLEQTNREQDRPDRFIIVGLTVKRVGESL